MSRPNEDVLNKMFEEMVNALRAKLASEDCPVSAISAAIQLLRDNDITCDPEQITPEAVGEALNLLPFPTEGVQ